MDKNILNIRAGLETMSSFVTVKHNQLGVLRCHSWGKLPNILTKSLNLMFKYQCSHNTYIFYIVTILAYSVSIICSVDSRN